MDDYCAPYKAKADVIISKWPEHLHYGSVLLTEDSAREYATVAAIAAVIFWSIWFGLEPLLSAMGVKSFTNLDKNRRFTIRKDCVHMVHHIGICAMLYYFLVFGCSYDNGVFPPVDSDWTYFRWINSQECRW